MSNLSTNHLISLFRQDFTTIKVKFKESDDKLYTYKCLKSEADALEIGCHVIVDVSIYMGDDRKFKAAIVAQIDSVPDIDYDSDIIYKWIVCKVDTTIYNEILEQEVILKEKIIAVELENKKNQYIKTIEEASPELLKELRSWSWSKDLPVIGKKDD